MYLGLQLPGNFVLILLKLRRIAARPSGCLCYCLYLSASIDRVFDLIMPSYINRCCLVAQL